MHKIPTDQKILNVFNVLLLEQHTTKTTQVNKLTMFELVLDLKKEKNNKNEKMKDFSVYIKAPKIQIPRLQYQVFQKFYLKDKSIWELVSAFMHFQKIFSIFYKYYLDQFTARSLILTFALHIDRLMVKSTTLPKSGKNISAQFANNAYNPGLSIFQFHKKWIYLLIIELVSIRKIEVIWFNLSLLSVMKY